MWQLASAATTLSLMGANMGRNLAKTLDWDEDDSESFEKFDNRRPNWKGPKRRNQARDDIRRKRLEKKQERQELTESAEDDRD